MSENRPESLFKLRLEVLLISQREDVLSRVRQKVAQNDFSFLHVSDLGELKTRNSDLEKVPVIIVSQENAEHIGAFSQRIEQLLGRFPFATIVTGMQDASLKDSFAGTQNERVIPLSQSDFFKTCKVEYICLLKCRSQFFDIAPSDLFSMTTLSFSVFVRMSLNQRYLGVAFRDMVLADVKHQKMLQTTALYILNREVFAYLEYINTFYDNRGAALKKRARALFLSICEGWIELNEYLLFDYKTMHTETVGELYGRLENLGRQVVSLVDVGDDLWDTLREALRNDFFEKWRAPWIAVYSAYISQKSKVGDPVTAFIAGLLCDVGLFDISDSVVEKYLASGEGFFNGDDRAEYVRHPLLSLNRCLLKNIPLSEEVKAVLVCVHERADAKGFPSQTPPELLPPEAGVIRFAEMIDLEVRMTLSEVGGNFRMLKEKIWERERSQPGNFAPEFLDKISESLL